MGLANRGLANQVQAWLTKLEPVESSRVEAWRSRHGGHLPGTRPSWRLFHMASRAHDHVDRLERQLEQERARLVVLCARRVVLVANLVGLGRLISQSIHWSASDEKVFTLSVVSRGVGECLLTVDTLLGHRDQMVWRMGMALADAKTWGGVVDAIVWRDVIGVGSSSSLAPSSGGASQTVDGARQPPAWPSGSMGHMAKCQSGQVSEWDHMAKCQSGQLCIALFQKAAVRLANAVAHGAMAIQRSIEDRQAASSSAREDAAGVDIFLGPWPSSWGQREHLPGTAANVDIFLGPRPGVPLWLVSPAPPGDGVRSLSGECRRCRQRQAEWPMFLPKGNCDTEVHCFYGGALNRGMSTRGPEGIFWDYAAGLPCRGSTLHQRGRWCKGRVHTAVKKDKKRDVKGAKGDVKGKKLPCLARCNYGIMRCRWLQSKGVPFERSCLHCHICGPDTKPEHARFAAGVARMRSGGGESQSERRKEWFREKKWWRQFLEPDAGP